MVPILSIAVSFLTAKTYSLLSIIPHCTIFYNVEKLSKKMYTCRDITLEASMENKPADKPTFESLADRAVLRQADIVKRSGLSIPTVQHIMRKERVDKHSLRQALAVINAQLGTSFEPEDIDADYVDR